MVIYFGSAFCKTRKSFLRTFLNLSWSVVLPRLPFAVAHVSFAISGYLFLDICTFKLFMVICFSVQSSLSVHPDSLSRRSLFGEGAGTAKERRTCCVAAFANSPVYLSVMDRVTNRWKQDIANGELFPNNTRPPLLMIMTSCPFYFFCKFMLFTQ